MKEISRVPIQKTLDWTTGKRSLRECLVDLAFDESCDLREREQECEDSGDFWSDRWLRVGVEGADFVVYLIEEES